MSTQHISTRSPISAGYTSWAGWPSGRIPSRPFHFLDCALVFTTAKVHCLVYLPTPPNSGTDATVIRHYIYLPCLWVDRTLAPCRHSSYFNVQRSCMIYDLCFCIWGTCLAPNLLWAEVTLPDKTDLRSVSEEYVQLSYPTRQLCIFPQRPQLTLQPWSSHNAVSTVIEIWAGVNPGQFRNQTEIHSHLQSLWTFFISVYFLNELKCISSTSALTYWTWLWSVVKMKEVLGCFL